MLDLYAYSLNSIFFCIQMSIWGENNNNKFTFLFLFIFSQNYLSIDSSYPPTISHTIASARISCLTISHIHMYLIWLDQYIYMCIYMWYVLSYECPALRWQSRGQRSATASGTAATSCKYRNRKRHRHEYRMILGKYPNFTQPMEIFNCNIHNIIPQSQSP